MAPRRSAFLAILFFGGHALLGACAQNAPPHQAFMDMSLLKSLDSVADTATVEHFRCLLGKRFGDTLAVVDAWEPPVSHADYNTVTASCPLSPYVVGTWHNHLPFNIPMNDPHNRATPVEPWSVCEVSPADRLSARSEEESMVLTIISVANDVHCAWIRQTDSTLLRLPWVTR